MDNLQTINNASDAISAALKSINDETQLKLEALQKLCEDIDQKTNELEKINKDTLAQYAKHESDTSVLVEKRKNAEKLLKKTQKDLVEAKNTLETTIKKHNDFMDYQARAEKALSARENSILKREESLEATIALSRRRKGILDDVT